MSFTTPVDGQPAIAEHIAQLTETLSGTRAIPVTMQTLTVTSAANLPNQSISNVELAADTARANLLTNGGFEIWQRGNGPFTSSGAYTADKWALGPAGTDTFSISKNTADADTANGSVACAACTFVLGTGAGMSIFYNALMAPDGWQTLNRPLTFSCRVRVSTANAVRLGGYTGTAWTYGSFHTGNGTYQTLSVTWTPTTSGNHSVAVFFSGSCTAYIDNAMLVLGSVAADYAPLHPADDLARCLRYYETPGNVGNILYAAYVGVGAAGGLPIRWMMPKPVTPTVTKIGTWGVSNCGQPTTAAASLDGCQMYALATATGQTQWNSAGGAYLTVEANP